MKWRQIHRGTTAWTQSPMGRFLLQTLAFVITLQVVTGYNTKTFFYKQAKKALHDNYGRIPTLYGDGPSNIEHVVPASILRRADTPVPVHLRVADPHNLHLACARMNSIRSNYRFSLRPPASHMRPVGGGNFVSAEKKLFVPRAVDWGPIVNSVLYCYLRYNVDPDLVIEGGLQELLQYKYIFIQNTDKQYNHYKLARSIREWQKKAKGHGK
eukprot:3374653-Rhodomonas_salina.1